MQPLTSDHTTITDTLQLLQQNLFDRSARNPLVNCDEAKLWFPHKNNSANASHIYQKGLFYEKEYGLKTSLLVHVFIRWRRTSEQEFTTSPLIFQSVQIRLHSREENQYITRITDENYFFNPVLQKLFREEFSLEFPPSVSTPEEVIPFLSNEFKELTVRQAWNSEPAWQLISEPAVGIFNYKKYGLYQDYERLISNPTHSVHALLEGSSDHTKSSADQVFSHMLDTSQQEAVLACLEQNTVIQGPPGNGKSHTLVALLKTLLLEGKKVLFVSQKRSALEVVLNKLKHNQLTAYTASFDQASNEKKFFYQHFRKTWESLAEKNKLLPAHDAETTQKPQGLLDFYPQKMTRPDSESGVSIAELEELFLQTGYYTLDLEGSGRIPGYRDWQNALPFLRDFEKLVCENWKIQHLADSCFFHMNSAVFRESDAVVKLARRIEQITRSISEIDGLSKKYALPCEFTPFTRYAIAAGILAMVNRNQLELLQRDNKKFKTFNSLAKKYQLTKTKLAQAELVNQNWAKKPSPAEIIELSNLLKQKNKPKSILKILQRNSAKTTDYFASFSSDLSNESKLNLLEELRIEWQLRGELETIAIKLKHELQILNPETEIDHILRVRSKLDTVSENEYIHLLEHPDSLVMIRELSSINARLSQAANQLFFLLRKNHSDHLDDLKSILSGILDELDLTDRYLPEIVDFFRLPEAILHLLFEHPNESIDQLNARVIYGHLLRQTKFEPRYKKLDGKSLYTDYGLTKKFYQAEEKKSLVQIQKSIQSSFEDLEKLASSGTAKISAADKIKRRNYKNAKRTLVHEMNKTRQHLPIRELLENFSDTVLNIQPLWVMNPFSVSQFIPCQAEIFDYVIFDESSQIPLEDALPAIYRGKRIVVVGDSQQMPPGRFFSSNPGGKTLLDQASFYFRNVLLRFHYRSQHPQLIAFSNNHFYDGELLSFPSAIAEPPIRLIPVDGVFEDQKNEAEAIALANYYEELVRSGEKSVGVIAFSKEQETLLIKKIRALNLSPENMPLIRNLENVQGIEKDTILISLGYAKNKAGKFIRNFGPVNQERGANRLNVLFTRARKKMIVFSSITHRDFDLSDNPGVSILSGFLKFVQNENHREVSSPLLSSHKELASFLNRNNVDFQYFNSSDNLAVSAFVQQNSSRILLLNPGTETSESTDLLTILTTISGRFSGVKVVLNQDLIHARERTFAEILAFLKP